MAGGRNMEIINKVAFSLLLFSMLDVVLIEGIVFFLQIFLAYSIAQLHVSVALPPLSP